jgi:uncharacterized membrane protein YkvA (DUF1232 family)
MATKKNTTDDKDLGITDKELQKKLHSVDAEFVKGGAKKITDEDVEKVVNKAEDIKKRFDSKGPLGRFIEDAQLLISIVKDYWTGKYRRIPFMAVAAIVFSLLYVLNPMDLMPDFLPVIGELDDAAVVTICLLLVEHELHTYRTWKVDHEHVAYQ